MHVIDIRYLYHLEPVRARWPRITPKAKVCAYSPLPLDSEEDSLNTQRAMDVEVMALSPWYGIKFTTTYRIESFHPLVLKDIPENPVTFSSPSIGRVRISRMRTCMSVIC